MKEKQWRKHQCPQCLDYLDESGMHVCNQRIKNLIKNVEDWKDKNYEHDINIAYNEWTEIGKKEMTKQELYNQLSLIRDKFYCPDKIKDYIDEIRYDNFFEECWGMEQIKEDLID